MEKLYCLGNGPCMSFTPYMSKMANTLHSLKIPITFVTWNRVVAEDSLISDPENVSVIKLMNTKNTSNKLLLFFQYLFWMAKVFFFFLFKKDLKIICSRFENVFPIWCLSKFKKINYIYCDRDNLHSTYAWPVGVKSALKKLETQIARDAKFHLIPGISRDFTGFDNVKVIPNLPDEKTLSEAYSYYQNNNYKDLKSKYSKVVYINGWLKPTRGLSHIKKALLNDRCNDILFIIAGGADDEFLSVINERSNCLYLGHVSNAVALSYYYVSDVVIALYDPSIDINKVAEPNKWWDCALTKVPFITNYGITTLSDFKGYGNFVCIDYDDEQSLFRFLENDFEMLNSIKKHPTSIDVQTWDKQFEILILEFIR